MMRKAKRREAHPRKKNASKGSTTPRSFSPDAVSTALHQALQHDLSACTQEYTSGSILTPEKAVGLSRQSDEFLKKYESETVEEARLDQESKQKFLKVNHYLSRVDRKDNFPYGTEPIPPVYLFVTVCIFGREPWCTGSLVTSPRMSGFPLAGMAAVRQLESLTGTRLGRPKWHHP